MISYNLCWAIAILLSVVIVVASLIYFDALREKQSKQRATGECVGCRMYPCEFLRLVDPKKEQVTWCRSKDTVIKIGKLPKFVNP